MLMLAENNEEGTKLAIYDMLIHCLDRADRNLPTKDWSMVKVGLISFPKFQIHQPCNRCGFVEMNL